MEPIRQQPPAPRRLAPFLGLATASLVSGFLHCLVVFLLGIVVVPNLYEPPDLQILAERAPAALELEELVIERVKLELPPIERPEFKARKTVSGNETDFIDIGGTPDARLVARLSAELTTGGAASSDARPAALEGSGGPGTGSGEGATHNSAFGEMIDYMLENGLDIVVVMDTTGSMGGEIEAVKRKIEAIGGALLNRVPGARISIVSYKDHGEDYVVKGLGLTSDLADVQKFLAKIKAGGGGDPPEAVEEGLKWAVQKNTFRPRARKVILLFGDRPPHEQDLELCLSLASEFRQQQHGVVSTITCRQARPIPHFFEIARWGGGEAFTIKDSRRIMEELLVLVFGNRHREDVVEFFELNLLDRKPSPSADEAAEGLGLLSDEGERLPNPNARSRRKK